jgi:hypothetical protein
MGGPRLGSRLACLNSRLHTSGNRHFIDLDEPAELLNIVLALDFIV